MSFIESQNGKFFMSNRSNFMSDIPTIEEAANKLKQEKEAKELKEALLEAEKNKQEEINKKLQNLEMIPMFNKLIIMPYPENPYRKVVEGNIIVDYGGAFKNPDSGEMDKLETFVGCAKVIEVGPEVRYIQVGDDVYYDTRTVYPVPFMSLGYRLTTEPQILCTLNENLKERFTKLKR